MKNTRSCNRLQEIIRPELIPVSLAMWSRCAFRDIELSELIPQNRLPERTFGNYFPKVDTGICFTSAYFTSACLRVPVFGHGRFSIWKIEHGRFSIWTIEHGRFSIWTIEHGRFSILENRTWPIFDFRASNMTYFRFSGVEHSLFLIFGRRTWPIFDFRASNMAYV